MARAPFSQLIRPADGKPVLVDFFADWCGPCHALAPVLQQVARQHSGKLHVVKLDVDRNPAVAQQFRVQGVPTLILFKHGQPVWRQSGVLPAEQLNRVLTPHL